MIATIVKRFVDVGGDLGVLEEGTEVEVTRPQTGLHQLHRDGRSSEYVSERLVAGWCVFRRAGALGYEAVSR